MTHLRRLFTSCLRSIHHSWCLVAAMVGFLVGCLWSALSGQYIYLGTSVLIAALSAIILSLLLPTRFSAIFALALGFILAGCRLAPDLIALEQWRALAGQTLTISGTLTEDPSLTSGQIALRLGNLQIHPATDAPDPPPSQPVENSVDNPVENSGEGTSTPTSLPGTLYVTLSGSDGLTTDDLLRSDHLTLTGTLQAGFGTFAATLYRPTVTGWSRASPGDLAAQFKLWFAGLVQAYISSPASDLGLSYLLGYKAGLSDELSDTLQIVGRLQSRSLRRTQRHPPNRRHDPRRCRFWLPPRYLSWRRPQALRSPLQVRQPPLFAIAGRCFPSRGRLHSLYATGRLRHRPHPHLRLSRPPNCALAPTPAGRVHHSRP